MDIKQEIAKIENLFQLITNINRTIADEGQISMAEKELIKDYLKKILLKYQEIAKVSGVANDDEQEIVVQKVHKEKEPTLIVTPKQEEWKDLQSAFNETIDKKYAPFADRKPEDKEVVEIQKQVNEVEKEEKIIEKTAADEIFELLKQKKEIKKETHLFIEPGEESIVDKAVEIVDNQDLKIPNVPTEEKIPEVKHVLAKEEEYVPTMNDLLREKKGKEKDFNSLITKPFKDSVTFNDKISFLKDLFDGNAELFAAAITTIDQLNSEEEAINFINAQYFEQYKWKEKTQTASRFYELVAKKFGG
ncbi:MAG: hypothetical protein K1X55_05745 [Chitinophagales bacterium]|nr:hypothetical protein [Chitinophagales bacterium]